MEESIYMKYVRKIRGAVTLKEAEEIMRKIIQNYSQDAYERGLEEGMYPLGRGWD